MKFLLWILLTLSLVGCSRNGDRIIKVSKNDAEMNAAIAEAQRTLPEFWQRREREGEVFTGLLKVFFTDPGSTDEGEHMWVRVTDRTAKEVAGVLLGEPAWLKSVKGGGRVRFPTDRITDWLFIENGVARGAFTVRLLRDRMSPGDRKKHDDGYPFRFEE